MKDKHVIITLGAIIIVFVALIAAGKVLTEPAKKPILQEKGAAQDYGLLYSLYVSGRPDLSGRPYYGEDNASISLILYTDFTSPGAIEFSNTTLPWLLQEYVYTGKAKLYYKHYLTAQDYQDKDEAYYYAKSFDCYEQQRPEGAYDYFLALYGTKLQDVPELAQSLGANRTAFMECLKQQAFKSLEIDTAEVEQFGMTGISPWLYVGIQGRELASFAGTPAQDRLHRTIRGYQTTIGD